MSDSLRRCLLAVSCVRSSMSVLKAAQQQNPLRRVNALRRTARVNIVNMVNVENAEPDASKEEIRARYRVTASESSVENGGDLLLVGRGNFEDGKKRFLGNIHLADAFHAALALFLFFEQLAFARDVAAITFGQNVFAHG